mmetsp:Transcript_9631/g.26857  ORF Transcript_9631/g.26857 Transcript_9631/m.26857 type:complete len:283 (-) Transcript_9631:498-1346(-)
MLLLETHLHSALSCQSAGPQHKKVTYGAGAGRDGEQPRLKRSPDHMTQTNWQQLSRPSRQLGRFPKSMTKLSSGRKLNQVLRGLSTVGRHCRTELISKGLGTEINSQIVVGFNEGSQPSPDDLQLRLQPSDGRAFKKLDGLCPALFFGCVPRSIPHHLPYRIVFEQGVPNGQHIFPTLVVVSGVKLCNCRLHCANLRLCKIDALVFSKRSCLGLNKFETIQDRDSLHILPRFRQEGAAGDVDPWTSGVRHHHNLPQLQRQREDSHDLVHEGSQLILDGAIYI